MPIKLANNAIARLSASITASDTTLVLVAGEAGTFPSPAAGEWHPVTVTDGINMEIMRCTARSGGVLTVQRGQENTTARSFSAGTVAEVRMTAGAVASLVADTTAVQANVDGLAADVASDITSLELQIAGKASQASLDSLATTVSGKASQTDLNTLSATVAGLATSKADQSALNTLQAQVNAISGMPTGMMFPWPAGVAPTGALMCYGQGLSTTTYAALFAIIGYTFGGSGGTFNLPDMRGRTIAAPDNLGGTASGRLATIANTIGSVGGAETHTLTAAQIPAHAHTASATTTIGNDGAHTNTVAGTIAKLGAGSGSFGTGATWGQAANAATNADGIHTHSASTSVTVNNSTGGGGAHNNVQPTIIIPWAIKT